MGATSANAVDLPFGVVSPAESSTTANRTPTFAGTGAEGSTVAVTPAASQAAPVSATVLPDGTWTSPAVVFGPTATTSQQVVVTQTAPGGIVETETVNFSIPPVAMVGAIIITSPANGSKLAWTTLVVDGTAPAGSELTIETSESGDGFESLTVGATGTFSRTYSVMPGPGNYDVAIGGTLGGLPLTPATLSVARATLLPAPVMASPGSGATLVGSSVTFTGTAVPGRQLAVSIWVPDLPLGEHEKYAKVSDFVTVDPQGRWAVTIRSMLPGNYRAIALLDETTAYGAFVISEFPPETNFRLSAALANTGSNAADVVPVGVLLLLAGSALLVLRQRVRA